MLAIFKREFKSYFQNVIGWLFVAALLAVYGLYFYVYNLKNGYPYISYDLKGIGFIMMIAVPILTMRSLSDEKKTKTDQLMLTSPVSVGRIVAGKYFAMAAVYTIDIALFALSPLVLSIYGKVALSEAYVSLFGYWLYGLSCIAVGLFISSISESVIISAILTFAALFLSYMMQSITGLISSSGNLLTKV
ncbi:MAG TPA: copper ABC transporter permease, partial [Eubacterium sp.]|nr:copper ABC transporter permease [Eubacterium sp.]